jgi:hypothetical protein
MTSYGTLAPALPRRPFARRGLLACATVALLACAAPSRGADAPPAAGSAVNFPKGTLALSLYAGYDREIRSDPQMGYGAIGVGYYVFDNFSVTAEARTYYASQDEGHDTAVYDLDLLIRHHLFRGDRWTIFVDASAGVSESQHRIPLGGTNFNFIEETGVGGTYQLTDHLHLIGGVRYWHLSNARLHGSDENPGLNGFGAYLGVMYTF